MRVPKLNQVIISGRVTADLEMKYTPSGTAVARFTVAVDKSYKDRSGTWQNQAVFIQVVAWDKYAERAVSGLGKGCPVIVKGRLDVESYEKNGVRVQNVHIIAEDIQALDPLPIQAETPPDPKPEPYTDSPF